MSPSTWQGQRTALWSLSSFCLYRDPRTLIQDARLEQQAPVSRRAISSALDMNCVVLCFMLWNRVSSLYRPGYHGTHHVARCASYLSLPGTGISSRSYHTWQICFVLKIVSAACGVMIRTWRWWQEDRDFKASLDLVRTKSRSNIKVTEE